MKTDLAIALSIVAILMSLFAFIAIGVTSQCGGSFTGIDYRSNPADVPRNWNYLTRWLAVLKRLWYSKSTGFQTP